MGPGLPPVDIHGRSAWQLPAVLLVAAAVRALYLVAFVTTPLYDFFRNDHLYYREWGLRIAGGEWIGGAPFEQGPLYAYFLGALYRVLGPRDGLVLGVQLLGGLVTVGLIFWCARRLGGGRAALAAGILAALYGPIIFSECLIMKTFLEPLLVLAALAAGLRGLESGRARWFAAAGAAVGLGCLVREVHAILLVPLLFAAWLPGTSGPLSSARRLRAPAAVLLGCCLLLAPSFARNWAVAREPVVVSSAGGQNLYIAFGPFATGYYDLPPFATSLFHKEHEDFREEAFLRTGHLLTRGESSRYWLQETLRWVWSAPWRTIRLVGLKAAILCNNIELPDSEDFATTRGYIPLLRFLPSFGWILGPGLLGFFLLCRRRGAPRLTAGFAAVLVLEVLLTFNLGRYRAALAAVWLLCAGIGLAWLGSVDAWRAVSGRRLRLAGLCAAAVLTVFSLSDPPGRNRNLLAAIDDLSRKQAEDAIPHRRRIPELKRTLASAHAGNPVLLYNLGRSLGAVGRLSEAVQAYEAALAAAPDAVEPRSELIMIYSITGETARARDQARILVSLRPREAKPWVSLGSLLVGQAERFSDAGAARGSLEEAVADLSRAIALDPQNVLAHYWLGRAYFLLGLTDRSLQELETAQRFAVGPGSFQEFSMAANLARLARERESGRAGAPANRLPL